MSLRQFFANLPKWIASIITILQNAAKDQAATAAVSAGAKPLSVLDLLKQERGSFGPSPRTGGVAHRLTDADAATVAELIEQYALAPLDPAMMCAWFRGESYFDPGAINPNNQDAKPGETPEEAFLHTDLGIGQFDGKELLGMLPGLSWQDAESKAFDPFWAIPQFARMATGLLTWAEDVDNHLRVAGVTPPYGIAQVLAFEAYNAGRTGALVRVLNASPNAANAFAISANGGVLVPMGPNDQTTADHAFTAAERAKITDAAFGYGNGLNTRWIHYKLLLGLK